MAKYLLAGENINWMAILALLTFFIVFSMALVLVFKRNRHSYQDVARLPLEDTSNEE